MKVLVFLMEKGGAGKSTSAINIASSLHFMKKKVLLIDLDYQGSACNMLRTGLVPNANNYNIADLLQNHTISPRDAISKTSFGMDIVTSNQSLKNVEKNIIHDTLHSIKSIFAPIADSYDYIVIDTHPGGALNVAALLFATDIIMPILIHPESLSRMPDTFTTIENTKNSYELSGLKLSMILPLGYQPRVNVHNGAIDALREMYKDLVSKHPIEYSIRLQESTAAGIPMCLFDKDHQATIAYKKNAEALL